MQMPRKGPQKPRRDAFWDRRYYSRLGWKTACMGLIRRHRGIWGSGTVYVSVLRLYPRDGMEPHAQMPV